MPSRELPFPIEPEVWPRLTQSIGFAPQQIKVVELVLRGYKDKDIAKAMGIRLPTVRTYLGRAFDLTGAEDRVELILCLLDAAKRLSGNGHHPS